MGKVKIGDKKKATVEDHTNLNNSRTKNKPPIRYLKHMDEIILRFPHIGQPNPAPCPTTRFLFPWQHGRKQVETDRKQAPAPFYPHWPSNFSSWLHQPFYTIALYLRGCIEFIEHKKSWRPS